MLHAEAVLINNSKRVTSSAKIGQILAIKQQVQFLTPSIMSYWPNSCSEKSVVLISASHWSMHALYLRTGATTVKEIPPFLVT